MGETQSWLVAGFEGERNRASVVVDPPVACAFSPRYWGRRCIPYLRRRRSVVSRQPGHIGLAHDLPGRLPRLTQGGEQDPDQERDDRDHHQELDERESLGRFDTESSACAVPSSVADAQDPFRFLRIFNPISAACRPPAFWPAPRRRPIVHQRLQTSRPPACPNGQTAISSGHAIRPCFLPPEGGCAGRCPA